jgi:hypothetical protein
VKCLLLAALLILSPLSSLSLAQAIGDFTYSKQLSPESGTDTSFIYTTETGAGSRPGSRQGRLLWRCLPQGLTVILFADQPLSENVAVYWAFDGYSLGPPQTWASPESNQNHAASAKLFLPQSEVASFTARAERAQTLALRLDGASDPARYNFRLGGLGKGLQHLPCVR